MGGAGGEEEEEEGEEKLFFFPEALTSFILTMSQGPGVYMHFLPKSFLSLQGSAFQSLELKTEEERWERASLWEGSVPTGVLVSHIGILENRRVENSTALLLKIAVAKLEREYEVHSP